MKKDIHPEYYPDAKVICSCGNTFTVGSTKKMIRTDVCSACHPFFTGEQRLVDAGGQVERFIRRLEKGQEIRAEEQPRSEAEGEEAEAKEVEPKAARKKVKKPAAEKKAAGKASGEKSAKKASKESSAEKPKKASQKASPESAE
ncbi:MAG: 50S ribosomal protein L31 [Anaerolineae bacterium]